jgi:hypothetical protein
MLFNSLCFLCVLCASVVSVGRFTFTLYLLLLLSCFTQQAEVRMLR